MIGRLAIASLLGAQLLLGCAGQGVGGTAHADSYQAAQLIFSSDACLVAGDVRRSFPKSVRFAPSEARPEEEFAFLPLVSAVLPSLIDTGIDLFVDYLKRQKENLTASTTSRTFAILNNQTSSVIGCFTFVRGAFGSAKEEVRAGGEKAWNKYADKLNLVSEPGLIVEMAYVKPFSDLNYVYLQPVYVEFNKTAAERGGSKQVMVTFTMSAPGVRALQTTTPLLPNAGQGDAQGGGPNASDKESIENLAEFVVVFEKLSPGTALDNDALSNMKTPLVEFKGDFPRIHNAQATIVETEQGGDLLLKAAKILGDSKSKLSPEAVKGIVELLSKSEK